jgi:uncharacterized protein (TIGR02145 family)
MVYPTNTRRFMPARQISIPVMLVATMLLIPGTFSPVNAQSTYIQIISEPGVTVYFDTVMMGRIPDSGALTIEDIGPGLYEATAVKGDLKRKASIQVRDKNERILYFDMLSGLTEDRSPVDRPSKQGMLTYVREGIMYGTYTDKRDGKQYKTIAVDTCTWMAENLKYVVPGSSYFYPRDPVHEEVYGRLYTWESALDACPEGWHLPSDNDWFNLERHLGIPASLLTTRGWRTNNNPASLKSDSGWLAAGPSVDALGFSAFPGGFRDHEGFFFNEGYFAYFWTSSGAGEEDAWYRVVTHDIPHVGRFSYSKKYAFSIRCIRYHAQDRSF